MYTFNRAIAIELGTNKRWKEVNISTVPTSTLFSKYKQVYVVLTHTTILGELTLDLEDIASDIQANTGTISEYLTRNGNNSLPAIIGSPVIISNQAVFSDALKAGFHVDTIDFNVPDQTDVPQDMRPHLVVRPEKEPFGYDYLTFRKRVLANVNGFYHNTAANSNGYYIVDGNKSHLKSGMNYVGLLSFGTMGDLDIHQITEDMLSFVKSPDGDFVDKVYIKFDGCDVCEKMPILILGGYLIPVDNKDVFAVNSKLLSINVQNYPFAERYFESSKYLDFDSFNLTHSGDNDDLMLYSGFRRESYLRKYFTMTQTFLVLVGAKNIVVERAYPECQTVPHSYISYVDPKWPLVVGEGKHEVYWTRKEKGQWMIRGHDAYRYNYMFRTVPSEKLGYMDNIVFPGKAGVYSPAYFLKMISEKVVIKVK